MKVQKVVFHIFFLTYLLANDFGHTDDRSLGSRVRKHTSVALFASNRCNVHNATIVASVLRNTEDSAEETWEFTRNFTTHHVWQNLLAEVVETIDIDLENEVKVIRINILRLEISFAGDT
jgi:hypothetical protein